jgi:Mn2+/Fe2+ NRAMP family transporter
MMVVITLSLGVVQEMCARMGAVTGKGLSALIREHFGIRLVNNPEIMGDYRNGRAFNGLAWITVVAVAGLSVLMVVTTVLPALGIHLFGL